MMHLMQKMWPHFVAVGSSNSHMQMGQVTVPVPVPVLAPVLVTALVLASLGKDWLLGGGSGTAVAVGT